MFAGWRTRESFRFSYLTKQSPVKKKKNRTLVFFCGKSKALKNSLFVLSAAADIEL